MMENNNKLNLLLYLLFGVCFCLPASPYANERNFEHEFLLFPFLHLEVQTSEAGHDTDHQTDEHGDFNLEYGIDINYSLAFDRFRMINELFVSDDEIDLERFKLGYQLSSSSTLWGGRFHVPVGYWNSQYHHSLHLQTSVHRPAILEYEDQGGPLSNHMTGLLLSNNYFISKGNLGFHLALGTAPIIDDKLISWGKSATKEKHKWKTNAMLYWQPDELNPTQYGMSAGYAKITTINNEIDIRSQSIFGAFTHQDWQSIRLTSEVYLIHSEIAYTDRDEINGFGAAYAHVEYDFYPKWTVYARLERGIDTKKDGFLSAIGHDSLDRNLLGIRFDITRRQAISCEIPQLEFGHDTQTHMSIQWTGMFP